MLHIFLLMLDANNDNSRATIKSSSIKSCKLSEILYCSLNFKLIVIINASFVPFLTTFTKFLWPSNAFLQIYLGKFNRQIFQILTNFVISCGILACIQKNMTKIGSLKALFPNLKFLHLTTNIKALVNVFKFEPSSFTYPMILFLKPYALKVQ